MEKFQIVVKTLAGLEEILAKEIETLGGVNIVIGIRMVSFVGDKALLYKSNLWLRTALRVLKPIERFEASDPDDLYAQVKAIDWSKYVAEGQSIAIDNTIFSENFRNSRYAIYRAKDAICDWFVEHGMKRPKISVASADVQLNLHISDEAGLEKSSCQFSLDSSGEPLYKRGYKEQLTDAPISEVLAAGILLKAGWDGSRDLIDPMCGSGTFLIEAALIATNTPAGIYRKGYGFERWTVGENAYDANLWQELYDDDSQEREFLHHIWGSDISRVAIEATQKNVRSAGLGKYITLDVHDFEDYLQQAHPAMQASDVEGAGEASDDVKPMLVFNPPYGRRLFTDVPTFYRMVGSVLKKGFSGCDAWIISSDESTVSYVDPRTGQRKEGEPFDFVGLKPSIKIDLNNGGLTCQLRKYELFNGRFDEFRAEGKQLDKKSADEKSERKFEHSRKPSDKSRKSFDKDRKPFDKDRKDRKPFGHKEKPARTKGAGTDRAYAVRKDGSIVAKAEGDTTEKKPFVKREEKGKKPAGRKPFDKDRKPFDKDRKPFDKKGAPRKPFDKDRKPFGKKAEDSNEPKSRGRRVFDPNRPMFGADFDMSKAVLDYTQPENKD